MENLFDDTSKKPQGRPEQTEQKRRAEHQLCKKSFATGQLNEPNFSNYEGKADFLQIARFQRANGK